MTDLQTGKPDSKEGKTESKTRPSDEEIIRHADEWSLDGEGTARGIEKIYQVFAASAKRWEAIVYPSLIAFIVLAVYGFYLIYSLTSDVDRVVKQMEVISGNMVMISRDINSMSGGVSSMTNSVSTMEATLGKQLNEMSTLNTTIAEMTRSVHVMTVAMNQMRRDMSIMNHNVSRPMNFMNSFMPW